METLSNLKSKLSEIGNDAVEFSAAEKLVLDKYWFRREGDSSTLVMYGMLENDSRRKCDTCHAVKTGDHQYTLVLSMEHGDVEGVVKSNGMDLFDMLGNNLPFVGSCIY